MDMRKPTVFDRMLEEFQDDVEFLTEEAALNVVSEIRRVMEESGVTAAELARRIGKSRAYVSKVLNYSPNMTLRSLVLLAHALGARWESPRLIALKKTARPPAEAASHLEQIEAVAEEPPPPCSCRKRAAHR